MGRTACGHVIKIYHNACPRGHQATLILVWLELGVVKRKLGLCCLGEGMLLIPVPKASSFKEQSCWISIF